MAHPSPWFWRLRMAAEAAVAAQRTVVVVVNFMVAPAQGIEVFCWLVGRLTRERSDRVDRSKTVNRMDGMDGWRVMRWIATSQNIEERFEQYIYTLAYPPTLSTWTTYTFHRPQIWLPRLAQRSRLIAGGRRCDMPGVPGVLGDGSLL
jgi:hypothetical protein